MDEARRGRPPWPHALPIAALVAALLACAGGLWAARSSGSLSFVLPGASGVVVKQHGAAGLRIEYQAAAADYGWRDQLRRRLLDQGWRAREYTFGTTRQFEVTWYTRSIRLGPLEIAESAVVGGDPHDASRVNIEFHRRPVLRWPWAGDS